MNDIGWSKIGKILLLLATCPSQYEVILYLFEAIVQEQRSVTPILT